MSDGALMAGLINIDRDFIQYEIASIKPVNIVVSVAIFNFHYQLANHKGNL